MSNQPAEGKRFRAWQPLTPGGIAAFARARLARLLLIQSAVALVSATVIAQVLYTTWFPRVTEAISHLPGGMELRGGKLYWPAESPVRLSESRFLTLTVDLDHSGKARSPAHVQVEFARTDCRVFSVLGYIQFAYPGGWWIRGGRDELQPWWGAWSPALLALVGAGVFCALMLCSAFLSTVYFIPVWVLAFFMNRRLSLAESWRLCGAALMPGALFITAAIYIYSLGMLDLVRMLAAMIGHFLIGWVCLVLACWRLEKHPAAALKANPFRAPGGNSKSS